MPPREAPPASAPPPPRPGGVILFDGVCELCNTGARWVAERDAGRRFELLAAASDEARRRFPALAPGELARELHLVTPAGRVLRGADAVRAILAGLPGWGVAARILGWPVVRQLARPAYRVVARLRHRGRPRG